VAAGSPPNGEVTMEKVESVLFALTLAISSAFTLVALPLG
jgi:hypothetical protein